MSRAKDNLRWQPPSRLAPGKAVWGWVEEIIQDGESWLEAQPFWKDLGRAEDIIRGKEQRKADENRSDLTSNRLKRLGKEMVAAVSDVRFPEDLFTSDNKAYSDEQTMLSKVCRGIWYESRAPLAIRELAQWSLLGGTGYLWPVWKRKKMVDPQSTGMVFKAFGPRDVVPFMVDNRNWQDTYAVTMIDMMSLPLAHALFPTFQDKIKSVPRKRQQSNVVLSRMTFFNSLRGSDKQSFFGEQLAEVRWTLVNDLSINDTDLPIPMGDPGASWSYVVPFMGQEMPGRQASIDDCRMYPNKRLIITVSGVQEPVYDGPAWDWHGMFPARFTSDGWVTEAMGMSVFRDVFDLERVRQFTERAVDMKMKAQMDPGMKYDNTLINAGTAEELDPWMMRARLGIDGDVEKAFSTLLPPEFYKVGSEPFEWLEYLSKEQDFALGTNQISEVAKAKMTANADGAEDLLKLAGPVVRDATVAMESPFADVMDMVKFDVLQYMDTKRVMSYVGPDGITPETFDFDPSKIIPSHMPGEETNVPSKCSRMQRGKSFGRELRCSILPGSLHGGPQQAQNLLLLQGSRAGLPISPQRILRTTFKIENVDKEIQDWFEFQERQIQMKKDLQEAAGPQPGGPPPGAGQPGKKQPGRPPSGNKPPAAKTKGSAEGPRAVVSESG